MPLNGRNYQDLLTVRPGVVAYAGGGSWTQSTNGVRPDANGWMIDGQLNANPADGRSVINFPSPLTDAATLLPIDAIQEFNIQVSPKAEAGWKPGAMVNVAIRSGTNGLHGTAYAFGRDGSWDARDYFNPAPNVIPPLNLVQWGATAGGPIIKDKHSFLEPLRLTITRLGTLSQSPPRKRYPRAMCTVASRTPLPLYRRRESRSAR
jgi:hypothetical protein